MKINWGLLACICSLFLFAGPSLAGTVRPTLTITSPKAGQRLSNDVFTVTGTAAGKTGLTNVLYSLNNGTWSSVDTNNNNWTNWSVQVTLNPGTNMFAACAVDTNGLRSLTNTVRFVYVVLDTLTVLTNGNLVIKPNYNGMPLQIGENYSMTATLGKGSAAGSGFRNWTDASNDIVSSSATLQFTMASNLTFIANFGNILRPTINVKSTTLNPDGYAADYYVNGTASDSLGVTNVFYQLNTGGWQTATTTNHWTNWQASVTFQPGLNYFYAYAVNINSNNSFESEVEISYNSAPSNLAGRSAVVTDISGNSLLTAAFGKSTFSQLAQDTNHVSGVGSYTYAASGGNAILKFKYLSPPIAAKAGSQAFDLSFTVPSQATFVTTARIATNIVVVTTNNSVITTNLVATNLTVTESGYMQFSSVSNLALANATGQLIWTVGQSNSDGLLFQKTTYASQALLTADTNGGKYTYTQYSPVGSLFKLSGTNGTSYVLANFAGTNYGSYYEEDYVGSGHTNTDFGNFLVAAQKPGGNAPLTINNRNLEIFSGSDSFNEQFGLDTYSQDTLSTNFDIDVGDYTYTNISTNIGQLNLTVTAPPAGGTNDVLAGSTSAARLIFVGGNVGLFTNDDGSISTFVVTSLTNLVPASIASNTLNITYVYYLYGIFAQNGTNQFQFDPDGNFSFNSTNDTPSGTYSYTPFSPTAAMIQLNFITNGVGTNGTELDWLQLNFKTTNSGNYYDSQFDAETNFLGNAGRTFTIQ